jgi:hypothetical protein
MNINETYYTLVSLVINNRYSICIVLSERYCKQMNDDRYPQLDEFINGTSSVQSLWREPAHMFLEMVGISFNGPLTL